MYSRLMMRSILLNEDIVDEFDGNCVSNKAPCTNPVYLYLEEMMTDDEWYRIRGVVLRDGRLIVCEEDETLAELKLVPQLERWDTVLRLAREEAAAVLNGALAPHGRSAGVDTNRDDAARLLRQTLSEVSHTATTYSIQTMANMLSAVEDCEKYPFSRDIAEFRDWPFVDVTEFQEEDAPYGVESVFLIDLHQ